MIRFSLFGIPVTVRPSFLLIAALLGLGTRSVVRTALWVGVVFVSILIHELGHALVARSFGSTVTIELNGIGGLTTWTGASGMGPGRRALVAASGSAVGVVFGLIVLVIDELTGPHQGLLQFTLANFILVNVFWGLLNWLPVRPLDGGHLLVSLLEKLAPERGPAIARVTFIVTAAVGAFLAFQFGLLFAGLIALWLLAAELTGGTVRNRHPAAGLPVMTFDDDEPSIVEEQREDREPG